MSSHHASKKWLARYSCFYYNFTNGCSICLPFRQMNLESPTMRCVVIQIFPASARAGANAAAHETCAFRRNRSGGSKADNLEFLQPGNLHSADL